MRTLPVDSASLSHAPAYSAQLSLALEKSALMGVAHVERDTRVVASIENFFSIVGIRVTTVGEPKGTRLVLPLSAYPGRVVAWQAATSTAVQVPMGTGTVANSPEARWLQESVECRDETVAAAVLASHGRAWIEERDLEAAVALIERVLNAFASGTLPNLWAHYLLALNGVLREDSLMNIGSMMKTSHFRKERSWRYSSRQSVWNSAVFVGILPEPVGP